MAEVSAEIAAIEEAFVAQWANFGHAPGGTFHETGDLVWAEAPVPQLPYNAVLRTRLGTDAAERIDRVIDHFRRREVQFMWVVHPTATPSDLAERLAVRGLSLVENATGMSLDLTSSNVPMRRTPPQPPGPINYFEVTDEHGLRAFEELMVDYWELPEESRPFAFGLSRWAHASGVPGVRWVAYRDGEPVGKAYLSLVGSERTAAIFGVYVRQTARGLGIARALNELAVARAADLGMRRVVLHSTEMAVDLYRRVGFTERCMLPVYATTPLHRNHSG